MLEDSSPGSLKMIGLSYQKTDLTIRGKFSLNQVQQELALQWLKQNGCQEAIILSTCNRTELYALHADVNTLATALATHAQGDLALLKTTMYAKTGTDAIKHLFKVGSGLDSQIIGDFEIIGQLKKSFVQSKAAGLAGAYTERLVNAVIRTSKRVKVETNLSSGATSVAFAGVNYIKQHVAHLNEKRILLFGTGKMGRITCENLVKHSTQESIVLINRHADKAKQLSAKYHVEDRAFEELADTISTSDIVFVSTGASTPTVRPEHIQTNKPLLILDLSVPANVDAHVGELNNVKLVHIDELSQMVDQTIGERLKEVPKAEHIAKEELTDFLDWLNSRELAPTLNALRNRLKSYRDSEILKRKSALLDIHHEEYLKATDSLVQKITNKVAGHLRNDSAMPQQEAAFIRKIFDLDEDF